MKCKQICSKGCFQPSDTHVHLLSDLDSVREDVAEGAGAQDVPEGGGSQGLGGACVVIHIGHRLNMSLVTSDNV